MLDIYEVALRLARLVGAEGARIVQYDKDLARQMRRAMASVVLNIAEGSGGCGGTRRQRYRDALGSAREVLAALELGEAMGYGVKVDVTRSMFNHVIGVLVRCTQLRR